MKHTLNHFIVLSAIAVSVQQAYAGELAIASAGDYGGAHANYPASNAIDGSTAWASRWAANTVPANLYVDLGSVQNVTHVAVAWGRGDSRSHNFEIRARATTSGAWDLVYTKDDSSGATTDYEVYDITDIAAQQIRVKVFDNSTTSDWTNITEIKVYDGYDTEGGNDDDDETGACTSADNLSIDSAFDDGGNDGHGPDNAIDNDFSDESRWSYNGSGNSITFDLGSEATVNGLQVAWFKGDQRQSYFDVDTSSDNSTWTSVLTGGVGSGSTTGLEDYTLTETQARYVRVTGYGNSSNSWNSMIEANLLGCGDTDPGEGGTDPGEGGTDPGEGGTDPGEGGTDPGEGGTDPGEGGTDPGLDPVTGDTYTTTAGNFEDVIDLVSGGDEIIVTGSGEIAISEKNFSAPVLIRAASVGGTTLVNATIKNSNNVTLHGFTFGPNDESTLLKIVNSTNIKVLRNTFDHTNVTNSQSTIVMTQASEHIEIGYNLFYNKNIDQYNGSKLTGSFIKTQFDDPLMTKNLHVHHNHFNNITPYVTNGSPAGDSDREAIAMGIADSQSVVTGNIVEYNLFENCDGENEIITVKTSGNTFRYNTFKNSMGSLSFRLGTDNEAYGNYFYGVGSGSAVTDDNYQTGGIRVYGSGHQIYDNYMEGLTGTSWRRPILVDSGDVTSSIGNDSHQVSSNMNVYNNTIINSVGGGIHIGSGNYNKQPTGINIDNNTVVGSQGILFNNYADESSNAWTGNQAYATGSATAVDGGSLTNSEVLQLTSSPSISAPTPLTASDVGPYAP